MRCSQGPLESSGGSAASSGINGHLLMPPQQGCCADEGKPDSSQAHTSSMNGCL